MKNLVEQLNSLKDITPSERWITDNRRVLLSQISSNRELENKIGTMQWFNLIMNRAVQPVPVLGLIIIFFMASGAVGIKASYNSKPGDVLYTAKIANEKARFFTTFDNQAKVKLNLEFANNRAKELAQVLAEPNSSSADKKQTVKNLTNDFKNEVNSAKQTLNSEIVKDASFDSNGKKIELAVPSSAKATEGKPDTIEDKSTSTQKSIIPGKTPVELTAPKATSTIVVTPTDPTKVLDEAQKLIDQKDYNGAVNKLDEASKSIQ